jgi:hypothetical protein
VGGVLDPLPRSDAVCPELERTIGRDPRIELADRARRGVAGIRERGLARLRALFVQLGEARARKVDLSPDLDQARGVRDPLRDVVHRADVVGHVLAHPPVAPGDAARQLAALVDQRDREAIDLWLGHVRDLRGRDVHAIQHVCDALLPRAELLLVSRVAQREHLLRVRYLLEFRERRRADLLGRGIGGDQIGVLRLDLAQLVEERVVLVVADLRRVLLVVQAVVVLELVAQLLGALGGALHGTHRRALLSPAAPPADSAARSSMPSTSQAPSPPRPS